MEKIMVRDLPKRKDLIGKEINIQMQGGKYHYDYQDIPKVRKFKGAQIKKINGVEWAYWYYEPKPKPSGFECGMSGCSLKENFKDAYILV